ncbi:MAG: glycosyltransferase family 2 protein [Candidatus Doudnabacteria bacterium]|nr:glycosyltransferase family 2 protein [Candidatus Doudnabacteria bacterium]
MISIIVPMKNEEKNCKPLADSIIKTVRKEKWKAELILVDDASDDKTPEILDSIAKKRNFIKIIHRRPPSGPGRALRAGFKAAKGDKIVTMDGDLSHDPGDMPKLVAGLASADMVCGSRNIKGGRADMQKRAVGQK